MEEQEGCRTVMWAEKRSPGAGCAPVGLVWLYSWEHVGHLWNNYTGDMNWNSGKPEHRDCYTRMGKQVHTQVWRSVHQLPSGVLSGNHWNVDALAHPLWGLGAPSQVWTQLPSLMCKNKLCSCCTGWLTSSAVIGASLGSILTQPTSAKVRYCADTCSLQVDTCAQRNIYVCPGCPSPSRNWQIILPF